MVLVVVVVVVVVVIFIIMSIFISPLQQQNHTGNLKYNKLTFTIHLVMQKKKKKEKRTQLIKLSC